MIYGSCAIIASVPEDDYGTLFRRCEDPVLWREPPRSTRSRSHSAITDRFVFSIYIHMDFVPLFILKHETISMIMNIDKISSELDFKLTFFRKKSLLLLKLLDLPFFLC